MNCSKSSRHEGLKMFFSLVCLLGAFLVLCSIFIGKDQESVAHWTLIGLIIIAVSAIGDIIEPI